MMGNPAPGNGFKKGNPGGRGGARPGAGMKPCAARKALQELLDAAVKHNGKTCTLVEKAILTLKDALNAKDELGQPSDVAVRAAINIADRAFGKPVQTHDVTMSGTTIVSEINQTKAALLASQAAAAKKG